MRICHHNCTESDCPTCGIYYSKPKVSKSYSSDEISTSNKVKKSSVFKKLEFTMLLISFVIITVVVVDIIGSKEQEQLKTFATIWGCNLVGIISNIMKRK
jgi:hypothetical protein